MRLFIFSLIALCATACNFKSEEADIIVHNGVIYTMNEANDVFQAMAIRNGKVVAVGAERAILNYFRTQTKIDLAGKPVYPIYLNDIGINKPGFYSDTTWQNFTTLTSIDSTTVLNYLHSGKTLEFNFTAESFEKNITKLETLMPLNNDLRWRINASDSLYLAHQETLRKLALIPVLDTDNSNTTAASKILGLYLLRGYTKLSQNETIKAYTTFNSIALKAENKFGSLDSGKTASFAVYAITTEGLECKQSFIEGKEQ